MKARSRFAVVSGAATVTWWAASGHAGRDQFLVRDRRGAVAFPGDEEQRAADVPQVGAQVVMRQAAAELRVGVVVRRGQALHDGGRDAGIGRLEGRGEPAFRGFLQQLLGAGGLNKFGALEPSVGFPHGGRRAQHRDPGQFIGVITC